MRNFAREGMMNAINQRKEWTNGIVTLGAAALVFTSGTAAATNGGTIQFVGAIVAPTFSVANPSGAATSTALTADVKNPDRNSVTVAFSTESNSTPLADVALTMTSPTKGNQGAAASRAIAAQFSDGQGQRLLPDRHGNYRIGASGGRLRLTPQTSPIGTRVTVSTSYE